MHKKLVAHIVSGTILFISLILFIPLAWAVYDNWKSQEVIAFVLTIFIGIATFLLLKGFCRTSQEDFASLNAKDGLAVVGLSWICLSFLGALPFYFSHTVPSFSDAFFETASGYTTTGASVIANVEILPRGILFWRSLTQWLGGMGIIVLSVALLPMFNRGAFQFYKAEAPGPTAERLQPKIKETAKILWRVYLLLSLAQIILLMFGGMSPFDALCHTFTTMATGGFSTRNTSIATFNPFIQWVIIVFMFFAGTNFMLHYQALRGNFSSFYKNEEFRFYFSILFLMTGVFSFVMAQEGSLESPIRHSAFQVVSIMTTTGYATKDFNAWPQILRFLLLVLMFIGSCAGSTGGGVKVVRLFVSMKIAVRTLLQSIFPNAIIPIKVNSSPVSNNLIVAVLSYLMIFLTLLIFGTAFLTIVDSCDLVTAFSAAIASLSNIGPGLAKVGPTLNYAWLSPASKWVLTFLMLAGRLELYSILILFIPASWRK